MLFIVIFTIECEFTTPDKSQRTAGKNAKLMPRLKFKAGTAGRSGELLRPQAARQINRGIQVWYDGMKKKKNESWRGLRVRRGICLRLRYFRQFACIWTTINTAVGDTQPEGTRGDFKPNKITRKIKKLAKENNDFELRGNFFPSFKTIPTIAISFFFLW